MSSYLPPGVTDAMIDGLTQDPEELCNCDHRNYEHDDNGVCKAEDCECTEFDNYRCELDEE